MHTFLLRLLRRRVHQQPTPTTNIAAEPTRYPPLRPWQIRNRCFNIRRHGLDPVEIRTFLDRVADELAAVETALSAVQEENIRIKNALWAWQSEQAAYAHRLVRR